MAAFFLLASPILAADRQVLSGHRPAVARSLQPLGVLPGGNRLDLAIGLRLRNRDALTNLLQQLYDPASTNYHHYLTPEEFTERFGPTDKDYQAVIAFAYSNRFKVTATHPNRTLLDVNGSVADIEKAFHFRMRVFKHPAEGRTFYAPDAEPSLDLTVPLSSVSGLDDFVVPRPMLRVGAFRKSGDVVAYTTGSGPRGYFIGKDFREAYAPGVSLDGAGQSVGLFQLDGYYPSDIASYEALAGLPNVSLTNVLLNGVSGNPGFNNIEVALDIDMAISMAPGLDKVIVYEGRVPNDILNRMATDNLAKQLSSSWGFGQQVDATREQIYMQFAAQGQTMFQASGDLGAWVGPVFPPSDDPLLTVVGGTILTTSGSGDWLSETTWPSSGGGISTTNPIPSYQQGLSMVANQGSTSMRNIPDVAAVADGIWVIVNNGEQGVIGGTSASAPLWAGLAALANQQAAASGKPSIGFLNPAIYAIGKEANYPSSFRDITTGNNTNSSSSNKFFAVAGYDLCTGWGTPTGSNLISALVTPPDTLRITPVTSVTASGIAGGPFNPAAQSYSLTNFGTSPLSWALVNTSLWLIASPVSGSLTSGGPAAKVTLALNSAASNLSAGSFSATVLFSNSSLQSVQSRQFSLAVVTPPVIAAQPANQTVFEGMTAIISVATSSNALLFYRWRYDNGSYQTYLMDGANISGSATRTLTIANATSANVGAYSVIVSNAAGTAISSNAFLSIVPWRPVIIAQPTNQTVLPEQTVALQVAAVGSQPLLYRWQKNGTNLTDSGNVSGTASSTLTLSGISPANAGTYTVAVSNALGSVTSTGATVIVVPSTAPEVTMATVYSFTGGSDGGGPNGLTRGANGSFYGTTQHGGSDDSGTVFSIAPASVVSNLRSFTGTNDGANPFAALLQSPDGCFYGTTFQGGAYGNGTVFRINPNGALTTLVSFDFPIGDLPYAGLTLGPDGKLYGTTYQGGAIGYGTAFQISTNGTLKTLCSFTNGSDGGLPYAGLAQGADGKFYGTTYKGGAYAYGTVYRVSASGVLITMFSFDYAKGAFPYAGLVQGADGNLYGTTSSGGAYGGGTVFRLTPSGLLTNLYSFTGGNDGGGPAATLFLAGDGNFYGTTAYGGAYGVGTLYRMTPNAVFATLAQFNGYNGANPKAPLTEGTDGSLYGTTENGGENGEGTIFRLSITSPPQITAQPVSQTVFTGSNVTFNVAVVGSTPLVYRWRENGTNLSDGGNISGSCARILTISNVTTANAGSYSVVVSNALGSATSAAAMLAVTVSPPVITAQPTNQTLAPGGTAIFDVTAQGNLPLSYRWQKNGTNVSDGGSISGSASSSLTIASVTEANNGTYAVVISNNLGSVTSSNAVLTVIPVSAPGTRMATLYSFTGGADGRIPNGLAQAADGDLYGTTQYGGTHLIGTAFRLTTNGMLTSLVSFGGGTNGAMPRSALTQGADGDFYGTTYFGGNSGVGTFFKMTANGALAILYSFTGESDGGNPSAALIQGADGNFYGVAEQGGIYGYGTIFAMAPNGVLSNFYAFTGGSDGGFPVSALVQGADGNFYGTTPGGGTHGYGNVFRLTPNGAFTNLYSFNNGTDGSSPTGALVQGSDGSLYGTTKYNTIAGFQFYGTIFRITTNGALTTLYALNYTDGANPTAGVIEGSDGNFYGTTYGGANDNNGTVFSISPNGALTNLVKFDGFNDGAHPDAALIEGSDGSFYGTTTTGGPGGRGTVFRLSITSAPWITAQPVDQVVWPGANVAFSVAIFGAPPLAYRWQKNGANLTDGGNLSGSTTRVLSLTNVNPTNVGTYSVIVSNFLGSVTSGGALLTILSPPFIQTVAKTNTTFRLTWTSIPGQRYRLQSKIDLSFAVWSNLGNIITASSNTVTASDPIGSNSQRFYRVVLLP